MVVSTIFFLINGSEHKKYSTASLHLKAKCEGKKQHEASEKHLVMTLFVICKAANENENLLTNVFLLS